MTFEEAWATASKVGGMLTIDEAKELWRTTQSISGEIVDIGCGTRVCLLLAATGPITSAIPFDEFDEHSYAKWRDQIINSGHAPNIYVIKKDNQAYHTWELPVGLLLMNVWDINQFHGWKMHLAAGAAVVIFNFSGDIPEDFKKEKEVGSLTTIRYSPKVTGQ